MTPALIKTLMDIGAMSVQGFKLSEDLLKNLLIDLISTTSEFEVIVEHYKELQKTI